MRNWGIAVTVFYALAVLGFLVPGSVLLAGPDYADLGHVFQVFELWLWWVPIGIVVSGQAFLLFLSVDTSHKRFKPRAHILVSCLTAGMLLALLAFAAIWSLAVGIFGDKGFAFGASDSWPAWVALVFGLWAGLWLFWGILFYRYFRESPGVITRATSWLLKGSVLELLVAVPCHIIVRHRKDCSAPIATSFGIATGIAIMLLSFGPSVLLLYKKRLDARSTRGSAASQR